MDLDIVIAGYIVHEGKLLLIHHRKLDKWLPVGGHIRENETPDNALRRETLEEVGLEIDFMHYPAPRRGNRNEFALPFYINQHHITQDHLHYCLFYLCKPKSIEVKINEREIKNYRWFTAEELLFIKPPLNEGDLITCREAIGLAREI